VLGASGVWTLVDYGASVLIVDAAVWARSLLAVELAGAGPLGTTPPAPGATRRCPALPAR